MRKILFAGHEKVRRRSQIEMEADCLEAIRLEGGKALPTRVMYRANLSWTVVRDYLVELEKNGLIEVAFCENRRSSGRNVSVQQPENMREGHRYYALTGKGILWLQNYESLLAGIDVARKEAWQF